MNKEYIFLNSRDELLRLNVQSIVYFEADGNYTNIVCANKLKSVVCMTLGKTQEVLSASLQEQASIFARVGKKHIINMKYVQTINTLRQKLILSDGHTFAFQLDISKEALKNLKTAMILMASGKFH